MPVSSRGRARPAFLLIALAFLGLSSSCSGGSRGSLILELAPTMDCADQREAFPADWECIRLQICRSAPLAGTDAGRLPDAGAAADAGPIIGDPNCVELVSSNGDHTMPSRELVVERAGFVSFDARLESGVDYDVIVTAYAGAAGGTAVPEAIGRSYRVRFGENPTRVRLYRYDESSCAGRRADGEPPLPRALGVAVPLPSGDVLLLGGVAGENVAATRLESVAPFQRDVEVYDADDGRFYDVAMTGPEGEGLARAFFDARMVGRDASGRALIRAYGGFTSGGTGSAVRFDATLTFSAYGAPLLPGVETVPADTIEIVYDEATRTATYNTVGDVAIAQAGFNAVSELVGDDALVVLGIGSSGGVGTPAMIAPSIVGRWALFGEPSTLVSLRPSSDPMSTMPYPRFGASATWLAGDDFLVWGGNVAEAGVPTDTAGVLLRSTSPGDRTGVAADALMGMPAPTAFHVAARLADDRALISGGLGIAPYVAGTPSVRLGMAVAPFSVIARDAGVFRGLAVGGGGRPSTILHTATTVAPGIVLVTGGAETQTMATTSTLWAVSAAGTVSGAGDAWTYTPTTALREARWGHTATLIPGRGILVTGGFARDATTQRLSPVDEAELILLDDLLGLPRPAPILCAGDAGVPRDAGRTDAGMVPTDAPIDDAPVDDAPVDLDAPP